MTDSQNYHSLKDYIKKDIEKQSLSNSTTDDIETNTFNYTDTIKYLEDIDNKKCHKEGNCLVKKISILNFSKKLVIGPNWPFFLVGTFLFVFFDIFILLSFYAKLSNLLFFSNLLILFSQIFLYFLNFISDPGIINRKKANFEDDSEISCSLCLATKNDRAFHCKMCGLCIEEYDHHCVWIGKCVGKRNYVVFYLFVVNTMVYFVVILFISGVLNMSR